MTPTSPVQAFYRRSPHGIGLISTYVGGERSPCDTQNRVTGGETVLTGSVVGRDVILPDRFGRLAAVFLLGLVASAAAPSARGQDAPVAPDKISPAILAHRQQKIRPPELTAAEHRERVRSLGLDADNLEAEQCALYVAGKLTEQEVAQLEALGIEVNPSGWVPAVPGRHDRGFHLAVVSYDNLDLIRQDDRFVFAESVESLMYPTNLAARAMINADDVSNGNGVTARTGAGVKIAIADSGIDLTHADFPTPVETFDMTTGTDPSTWSTNVANTVTDHGTHVTGSALGRGVLGPYQGAADGASLYFYKIGQNAAGAPASDTDIIEAINRFVAVAGSGPRIFSMSYGGLSSAFLDGSGPVCQAIDNATTAGVTCFISAGNEQWSGRHDSMTVVPGTMSGTFGFVVNNSGGTSAYSGSEDLRVIWRDGMADDNMVLSCTNCSAGELSLQTPLPPSPPWVSPRGTEARQYSLNLSGNPVPAGQSRTYNLQLQNTAGSGATPLVHVYRFDSNPQGVGTFSSPDPSYTIVYPGVADTAITIGAWVQANGWTDWQNSFWQYTWLFTNTLAPFSGLGPRIDGAQKPDIVAPGAVTISCKDSTTFGSPPSCGPDNPSTVGFPLNCLRIDNDGFIDQQGPADYYVHYGASMATPMAAGAAALMLEAAPTMTPADVKNALAATAMNVGLPGNSAGAGLVDILAAIQSVDCDDNGVYDVTEVGNGSAADCDGNGRPDACDIADGTLADCNGNGAADLCDISSGASADCNTNSAPDECDITPGPLQFGSEVNSGLGTCFLGPMAAGRFDGGGNLDLIHLEPAFATATVLLGNGNNTFGPPATFNVGANSWQLIWALDVEGDGDEDLLLGDGGALNGVTVAPCNGDGTFSAAVEYPPVVGDPAAGRVFDVAVGDVDRDGVLDLVAAEYWWVTQESGVIMFPGNGDGSFGTGTGYVVGAETRGVAAGDLDGDGHIDVVATFTSTNNDEIAVLFNNGDGTLASPTLLTVGSNPQRVAIADFDMDGHLDIAVANYNDGQTSNNDLTILFNNADGTFATPLHIDVAVKSQRVVVRDFNANGVPDVAVGHANSAGRIEYSVVLSNGDGTFASPVPIAPPTQFIGGSAFGDFDNDGDPDWAFHQSCTLSVLPNTTATPPEQDCNLNGSPDSCDIASGASGDCQSDGIPDECQLAGNDCNGNGVPDECDISSGNSSDSNGNGLPDECEPTLCGTCKGDMNGDNKVNGRDISSFLSCVLGGNPSTSGCPCADMDASGTLDSTDVTMFKTRLLASSSNCP